MNRFHERRPRPLGSSRLLTVVCCHAVRPLLLPLLPFSPRISSVSHSLRNDFRWFFLTVAALTPSSSRLIKYPSFALSPYPRTRKRGVMERLLVDRALIKDLRCCSLARVTSDVHYYPPLPRPIPVCRTSKADKDYASVDESLIRRPLHHTVLLWAWQIFIPEQDIFLKDLPSI